MSCRIALGFQIADDGLAVAGIWNTRKRHGCAGSEGIGIRQPTVKMARVPNEFGGLEGRRIFVSFETRNSAADDTMQVRTDLCGRRRSDIVAGCAAQEQDLTARRITFRYGSRRTTCEHQQT